MLYLDGAHNISGARSIVSFISNSNKETWVVLGMLKNKNLEDFLKTLKGKIKGVMAIKIPNENNSFSTQDIFLQCNKIGIKCFKIKNVNSLKKAIINEISAKQIVVTGSLYLIGKLRKLFI